MKERILLIASTLIALIVVSSLIFLLYYSAQKPYEPEIVSFPFSWGIDGNECIVNLESEEAVIKVTVWNVTYLGTSLGVLFGPWACEGYCFWGVYITYKNLLHRTWERKEPIHKDSFEIVTNRGNVYKALEEGFLILLKEYDGPSELRPEEEYSTRIIFEIRLDERPVELRHYGYRVEFLIFWQYRKFNLAYIWKIE